MIDEIEDARWRILLRAILRRAWDDLNSLLYGDDLISGINGEPMNEADRAELLEATLDWWLNPEPSPCSLDIVCEMLGLDPDAEREKAHALAHGQIRINTRRRRLSRVQIDAIMDALGRGETTRMLAKQFGLNQASIRKIRIRERRRANAQSAEVGEGRAAA